VTKQEILDRLGEMSRRLYDDVPQETRVAETRARLSMLVKDIGKDVRAEEQLTAAYRELPSAKPVPIAGDSLAVPLLPGVTITISRHAEAPES
jgi:hypothetical protein